MDCWECFYSFEFNFVFVFPRTTNFQFSCGFFFMNDQFFQILCRFNFLVTKHLITSRDVLHEKSLHVVLLRFTIWREKLKIADIIVICLFSSIVIFQIFFSDISHRLNFADRKFCVIRAKTNTLKLSFKRCFSIMGETWYLSKRSHIKHTWP